MKYRPGYKRGMEIIDTRIDGKAIGALEEKGETAGRFLHCLPGPVSPLELSITKWLVMISRWIIARQIEGIGFI